MWCIGEVNVGWCGNLWVMLLMIRVRFVLGINKKFNGGWSGNVWVFV